MAENKTGQRFSSFLSLMSLNKKQLEEVLCSSTQGTAGQYDGADRSVGCDLPWVLPAVIYLVPLASPRMRDTSVLPQTPCGGGLVDLRLWGIYLSLLGLKCYLVDLGGCLLKVPEVASTEQDVVNE